MKIKGIKRGKNIELLEEIAIPDNQEIILEISNTEVLATYKLEVLEQSARQQDKLDDSEDIIIQDFMKISESALDEYWLNEEEDEACKNLYNI
ncbi:hypothetical protein NIES4071_25150 [Calothrix sp. NIES-4071]|nr:hypothetical protein NIES4071_25150 [Calothrix sp. NIES-4071]BAZ56838.1 hypothetical protein NIES4105_25090 [Calothrix sp. NIES-4105]